MAGELLLLQGAFPLAPPGHHSAAGIALSIATKVR
jgi:hypothetical protein